MDVFAKSIEAKDDLRTFVWDFGQEHNQVCIVYCIYFFRQITTILGNYLHFSLFANERTKN